MTYIGIDIGTTGCKCMAFNDDMEVLSESYFEYPLIYGKNGEVEQDPDEWWTAARSGLSEVTSGLEDIKAIGVSSQGITVIPVDNEGNKLCNALTWLDMRAVKECEALENKLGRSKIGKITGKRVNPAYTLPKLMWIKEKRPAIYKKTHKFLLAHDFIINKLCGEFVTEDSLAAGTMAYDISAKEWEAGVIESAGISIEKLPFIAKSGSPIGKLNVKISEELGISENIIISTGGQDQKCAAFGAGLNYGNMTVSLGTSSAIMALFDHPVISEDVILPCFPFIDGQNWVLEGFSSTAGASIKWFRDNLGNGRNYKEIDAAIEREYKKLPKSCLMFFPYLGGTATPEWYDGDRGSFFGIGLETTDTMMAGAVLEGTVFNIRANIELMESLGRECSGINVFGGGSNSSIWLRMIADATGKTVKKTQIEETACLGAAMKAAESVGISRRNLPNGEIEIKPDSTIKKEYDAKYMKYKDIEYKLYGR